MTENRKTMNLNNSNAICRSSCAQSIACVENGRLVRLKLALVGFAVVVAFVVQILAVSAVFGTTTGGSFQEEDVPTNPAPEETQPVQQETDPSQPFATEEEAARAVVLSVMDRDPFDRLHFDDTEHPTLDIDPLVVEGYGLNQPIDPSSMKGRAVFTIPDYPDRVFAAPWNAITKVERYSDLVMTEARNAMDTKDFNRAFRTLLFLSNQPEGGTAELKQMLDRCIFLDGSEQLAQGSYAEALTAFEELYARNPRYQTGSKPVFDLILESYQSFLQKEFEQGNYQSVRNLLQGMRMQYGKPVEAEIARWNGIMNARALEQLGEIRTALDNNDPFAAQVQARKVIFTVPELPQATEAYNSVVKKFPYVFVGVTSTASVSDPLSINNWGARRLGRLLTRTIMEFEGPSDEGGKYRFPNGRFQQIDDLGLRYRFTLSPTLPPGTPELTAYELSNRLMDLADPKSPDYYIPWARMVTGIEIENERSITIRLRYPHVRPESIIPLKYFAPNDSRAADNFGYYKPVKTDGDYSIFEFNDRYLRPDGQLPTIVEKTFANTSEAADALLSGELDIIDRVHPFDIVRLRQDPMIEVKPYLIPLVHVLIPNPRNAFMKSDNFRRSLQVGINRELMLRESLTGGREIDGYEIISGPFPPGSSTADQLAYAYNNEVKPRQYDFRLSMVLAQQFVIEEERRRTHEGEKKPVVEIPEIVIAHPDTSTISAACKSIAQQLTASRIPVKLRPLPKGVTVPDDDDYDLLYCEIQIQEPLVDAYRLFGHDGLVKISDPTIEQALRQLDSAYSWAEVSRSLRRVHRQTSSNLTVLPLWQIVEHYAYRKNLYGPGDRLIHLYQNVDKWQINGLALPDSTASAQIRKP